MNPVDRLRVIYELDDSRYTRGIDRMRTAGDRFAREAVGFGGRAENAFGGVSRSAIAAAASIAGLGVALNKVRTATDGYKVIINQLRSIGQESDIAVDKLLSVAIRTRAPIEELATAVARIQKATGDGYDATLRRVETLNKVLAVGGATAQEVSSVMTQLSQALSGGVLQGDEFASLRESAPVEFLDALAAAAGATRGELKDLSSEGKLTSDIVIKALDSLRESADKNFAATAQTIGQAATNIDSAMTTFIGRVDEGTGSSQAMVEAMNSLSEWLVNNADEAVMLGQSLGAMFDVAKDRVGEFLELIDGLAETIREGLGTVPLDDFADGIDRVIGFIADLNGTIEGAAAVAKDVFLSIADNIADGLAWAINKVIEAVQGMVNSILGGIRTAAAAIDGITGKLAALTNADTFMGRGTAGLLGKVQPTKLAGSIAEDIKLEGVKTEPRSSSGKTPQQIFKETKEASVAGVLDEFERSSQDYGGKLATRQLIANGPISLGLPPVDPPAKTGNDTGGGVGGVSSGTSGGRKGRSGGKGRSGRAESPFFEDIEKDLLQLERQIELIGKSNEEVATAKARWELLDEAKKRGIPVNAELSAQIDAQAANVGRLTAELERGEIAQKQFDQAIDGVADAMAGALIAGESLRDGLAQVFKQIAADILNSGIRSALSSVFGGGGGSGILGKLLGAFGGGDPLAGALSAAGVSGVRSFDGGGFTGMAARSGGLDGKGGFMAMVHPNETIIDHSKGGRAGGGSMTIHIVEDAGFATRVRAEAEGVAVSVTKAGLRQYDRQVLPGSVARTMSNKREVGR